METKPSVLLVDDEDRFRTTLAKMLAFEGLEVGAAASGEAALEELKARPYDVVLLDVRMPGLSGVETLREIRKLSPLTEVIVLTGHASLEDALEIIRLGGFDYLFKPCPIEDLLAKIESAFEKKQQQEKAGRPPPTE